MTNNEALNHIFNIARYGAASYHPGYAWTVEYGAELKAYFGGVNLDKYMRIFTRRESDELFQQRKEITAEVQSALGMMLEKPVAKIERSNWKQYVVVDGDEDGKRANEFNRNVLSAFGTKGLFPYCFERVRYWNIYDPNCFSVVEWKDFDNNKNNAKPYPFEVTAEMAVDFNYKQSELLYLCCRQVVEQDEGGTRYKLERLTMYRPLQTVVLQELPPRLAQTYISMRNAPGKNEMFPLNAIIQNGYLVQIDNRIYEAVIPIPHGYAKTPAVRTGYIDNPIDDGATKLSIFHAALPFAKKLLKTNSEVDLTAALVASPIPIRYSDRCTARGCDGGIIAATGAECSVCAGTGIKTRSTSVQEEITVPLPESKEDIIVELSGMLAYIHFPPEAAALLISLWDKWIEKANLAVYNSELTTKSEVAQTARFHSRAEQGVNDALWPYSNHISSVCAELSRAIASAVKIAGGMAKPIIPSNLRFETVYDLFDELTAARTAGASTDACAILQLRIMEVMLQDDPEALRRAQIDDQHNPFRGMTEAQIIVALNNALVPEDKKLFFLNKSDIMEVILSETPNFYDMSRIDQKKLIDAQVLKIKVDLGISMPSIGGGQEKDVLGKVPLALQQLALARTRARDDGDTQLATQIGIKMDELLGQI